MSQLWKCPGCGEVLAKGLSGVVSPEAIVVGTATCGACGMEVQQSDVYGGRYDVGGRFMDGLLLGGEHPNMRRFGGYVVLASGLFFTLVVGLGAAAGAEVEAGFVRGLVIILTLLVFSVGSVSWGYLVLRNNRSWVCPECRQSFATGAGPHKGETWHQAMVRFSRECARHTAEAHGG